MNKTIELIRDLCQIDGVSGCEEQVAAFIQSRLPQSCQTHIDPRGNLICTKKGKKSPSQKLMFAAHMDEVGFIITYIEESGLLRFSNVGGIDTRVVVGKPVRLESGAVGVVGAKPIHLQKPAEQDEPLKMEGLYIDIGASSREEAEKLVSLGDRAAFRSDFIPFGSHKIKGKAIDDRAGCAVLMELLERELEYDITAVFTTQEEVGTGAAANAAYAVQPDIAVIVETTCAADTAGSTPSDEIAVQGDGPCISFKDTGTLYDMELYRRILKAGKKKGIPCQPKRGTAGSNDSKSIQSIGDGVRVAAVSMPCRYLHSPSCVLDKRDVHATVDLLEELVCQFGHLA